MTITTNSTTTEQTIFEATTNNQNMRAIAALVQYNTEIVKRDMMRGSLSSMTSKELGDLIVDSVHGHAYAVGINEDQTRVAVVIEYTLGEAQYSEMIRIFLRTNGVYDEFTTSKHHRELMLERKVTGFADAVRMANCTL